MKKKIKLAGAYLWSGFNKIRKIFSCSGVYNVPILCYHSVSPENTSSGFRLKPDNFEAQIKFIVSNYNVISLKELVSNMYKKETIKNAVVVTFDDGYKDNFTYAYPIFKKYNCCATIFLTTAFIEKEINLTEENEVLEPLTWAEIIEMKMSKLISFGAHGHTHRMLSNIASNELGDEIKFSKGIIEKKLGENIDLFAYPNGQLRDFSKETITVLKKNGFIAACSTIWSTTNTPKELYYLNRIIVDRDDDINNFKLKVSGAYDYLWFFHNLKRS
ncbi:MAG: polysaccharide deacetylase family protein [bacterium]|nr:polysaccharide deacetylase family protein [bacterium]